MSGVEFDAFEEGEYSAGVLDEEKNEEDAA